jgi:hypothetical protein
MPTCKQQLGLTGFALQPCGQQVAHRADAALV